MKLSARLKAGAAISPGAGASPPALDNVDGVKIAPPPDDLLSDEPLTRQRERAARRAIQKVREARPGAGGRKKSPAAGE